MAVLLASDTNVERSESTYTCGLMAMARIRRRVGNGFTRVRCGVWSIVDSLGFECRRSEGDGRVICFWCCAGEVCLGERKATFQGFG
jgi:hypothetical protein